MRIALPPVAMLVLACSGGGGKPATGRVAPTAGDPTTVDVGIVGRECPPTSELYELKLVNAGPHRQDHPAFGLASRAAAVGHDAWMAGNASDAASRFMTCARELRAVPDDHFQIDTARHNAKRCYQNAAVAFAGAGRFAAEGKAELETARTEDARMAPDIAAILANPPVDLSPECALAEGK